MRWGLLYLLLSAALLLLGCGGEEGPYAPPTSLLTFRYDAARDVVLAATHALRTDEPVTAQRYAEALARRPESGYAPSLTLRLASPEVAVQDDVLTVNYREAAGLGSLASAQVEAVMAALEGWRWVPGVREVRVQALGQPLTALGPLALAQPLAPAYHTYVVQPVTGEVGYLTGGAQPRTLAEAVTLLQRRTIRDTPALQGFRPLLPVGITLTVAADRLENGVQPVELSVNYPRTEVARLAGLVLNLAQFPTVDAVRVTFGNLVIDAPFMRANLNAAITPYDLLLPAEAAGVATGETATAIRTAAQTRVGATATFGPVLTWRDWAAVTTAAADGAAGQTVILRRAGDAYSVVATGAALSIPQLLQQGMPAQAIVALRLPGWENLALTGG